MNCFFKEDCNSSYQQDSQTSGKKTRKNYDQISAHLGYKRKNQR